MKLIFLDIDGVLNGHDKHRHPNGYCGIDPQCVYRLNRIVRETGAELVISSAWRYLMKGDENGRVAMNSDGFKSMLMTYGLDKSVVVRGVTPFDEETPDRGDQIAEFLRGLKGGFRYTREWCESYVVLDDGDTEKPRPPATKPLTESLMEHHAGRIVFTDGTVGLTDADANKAILILDGSPNK